MQQTLSSGASTFTRPQRRFSRKLGWVTFWVGLVGLLSGIILVVLTQASTPILALTEEPKTLRFPLLVMVLTSWVVWKFGKTILKLHDQDDINQHRHEQRLLESAESTSPNNNS